MSTKKISFPWEVILQNQILFFFYQTNYFSLPPTSFPSRGNKDNKGFSGTFWTTASINELPVANVLSFISNPGGTKDVEQMRICSSYRDEWVSTGDLLPGFQRYSRDNLEKDVHTGRLDTKGQEIHALPCSGYRLGELGVFRLDKRRF